MGYFLVQNARGLGLYRLRGSVADLDEVDKLCGTVQENQGVLLTVYVSVTSLP